MAQNHENPQGYKNGSPPKDTNKQHSSVSEETNAALLPQLESLERMMKFPVVEAAWHQGQDVYGKVKGMRQFFQLEYYVKLYALMFSEGYL